jgi:hypothetical protein
MLNQKMQVTKIVMGKYILQKQILIKKLQLCSLTIKISY